MPSTLIDVPTRGDPDAAVGAAARAALGDRQPWVAVQTAFSPLHGTVSPARWAAALGAFLGDEQHGGVDRRGANHPSHGAAVARAARASAAVLSGAAPSPVIAAPVLPASGGLPWAVLADVGDLAGLPACLDAWGRRLAVGATLPLHDGEHRGAPPVLILAPDQAAYGRLCRLLSWHNEDPDGWRVWLTGLSVTSPPWDGLVALVQDRGWAERLSWHGAEVFWRLPNRQNY